MGKALAAISEVEHMLANIDTVEDAATVRRAATAVHELLRQSGASRADQNRAAKAKIEAEWKGGRILRRMPGHDGRTVEKRGRPRKISTDGENGSPYRDVLKAVGLSWGEAQRWQRLADFDETRLAELITSCEKELTTAYMLSAWRREEKNEKPGPAANARAGQTLEQMIESGAKYGTVYADPPWLYGNQGTRGATGDHYPGMTVEEIAALPVVKVAADNAHLHLWTTNAFLFDARQVIEAWGFTYKSCFVWVKPQMGMGNYWRVSHEFCLLGIRGSAPFRSRDEMSWREWDRAKHSAKPKAMYELIEKVSRGPYLEMFARSCRYGWASWGHLEPVLETDMFKEAV